MNKDWSHFRDPRDGSPLKASPNALIASDGTKYEIIDDIPRFVSYENYAADFGTQWKKFPKTQLDSYSGISLSRDRLFRCMQGELEKVGGKRVLEAGSGAGRFSEILIANKAKLYTFDFSLAVEANASNNVSANNFVIAQADIRRIPFERNSFDYVICLGVLQHTPSPEQSVRSLWEMVAPGGCLIIDHYRWNLLLRLPPPLGDAEKLYRWIALKLPSNKRDAFTDGLTKFWFPIYWRFRNSRWALRILARIAGIHFYYNKITLRNREEHYEWSRLDTHDGMTDHYKHYRNERQIAEMLNKLGAEDIRVEVAGNGVEAFCRKPLSS